ncbi:carboxylate transporter [Pokkaliibacter plantistimulans]|uniref:Carboxylate transporter n=1 Tax=Pokkaliibacter plantistimulans TaxID=1635171 RepID=A0ABX5M2L5_9GAMM|nr:SLC13 family permease [Pokkaliibacter plantistimulans]PXF31821.1 carboxylate transporter [Pokkaliibacter plantistimulans]
MAGWLVLVSVGVLLALLIHGRTPPAVLFATWAGAFLLTGLVDEKTMLMNYTNPALITLLVLLLISVALERSAILDLLSERLCRGRTSIAILKLSSVTAFFSAFLNNTAVVGSLLNVVCKQKHIAPSKLLIPLSYASIIGGVTTLVGTSTNLIVNSFVINAGLPAIHMFDFAFVGLPITLLCILALVIFGKLLPENISTEQDSGQRYFLEAILTSNSPLIGKSIEENRLRTLEGLFLLEIARDGRLITPVTPDEILQENDTLVFTGEIEKFHILQKFPGLQVFGNHANELLKSNLAEVIISNDSELSGRTLQEVDFRTMFSAGVVGIRRGERRLTGQLGRIPLKVGDSLLLAISSDFIQHRNIDRNFHLLGNIPVRPKLSLFQSIVSFGGFALAILLSAMNIIPLLNSLLMLLAILLLSKIVTLSELRRRFPFELMIIIGSALTLAQAMQSSGAADLIANLITAVFDGHGQYGALIGIMLMTVMLTEIITNNAAAALAFPIALSAANALGVDPKPFIMAVAYGASACFMIPFGYQTHLMVYSPGHYRTTDFIKIGVIISTLYISTAIILIPIFFPFQ